MLIPFSTDFGVLILVATGLAFLFHKFKQPTIVAYILTGFVLGPAMLNVVSGSEFIDLLSELGLAFLLFFLGIEMNLEDLQDLFAPLLRITVLQRVMQVSLAFAIVSLFGFTPVETIILAVATVFGATPVIVKLLNDIGDLNTLPGRIDIGVLVLQDIYVVLLLAFLSVESLHSVELVAYAVLKILVLIGAIAGLAYAASRYVVPTVFRRVTNSQHAFFIHGIAWAFLFITLSKFLDLPVEIGAFFAGLALGQMRFHGELKERVRPLTLFFMVIFFSSIGLKLSWENLTSYWGAALITGALLMAGNFLIMYYLIRRERFSAKTSFLGALNMTQASEFTLVAGSVALSQGYIPGDALGFLSIMALATMTVSSVLIYYNRRIYDAVQGWLPDGEDEAWAEHREDHTVAVGFDDSIRSLLPLLDEDTCIIDNDSHHMEELDDTPYEFIYGNVFHEEIRNEADVSNAGLVISVIPSLLVNKHLVQDVDGVVIVKASNEDEAAELYELGADYVIVKDAVMGRRLSEIVQAWCDDRDLFNHLTWEEQQRIEEAS